jgi:acetolactate synthase-1/2/3 large subunit/sulfoacetaldehyde acetyltransferase
MFRPITKLSMPINKAERIPELVRHAVRVAMSGRQGPVFVDMPGDVFEDRPVPTSLLNPTAYRDTVGGQKADDDLIEQAATLLLTAKQAVILSGGGIGAGNGTNEVVQLAELLGLPLVAGYARQDTIPNLHPLYVGHLGRACGPESAETVRKADVILALGSRFSQFTSMYDNRFITPEAQIIQVDIEPKEMGRIYPVALGIVGDARAVTRQLIAAVQRRKSQEPLNPTWTEEARRSSQARWRRLEGEGKLDSTPMKPQRVYYEMRKVLPKNAIVTVDAGACPSYCQDRLVFHQPRSLLVSLDLGCLGFAFPEALGAKMAAPHRPVVALHGDGGFLFNAQELETAVRERIPVVCVVMNNGEWGSEKACQRVMYHGRYVGADITNPRFDKLAELFGGKGFYAERPEDVAPALEEALKSDVVSVVEVPVDPEELPYPLG